MKPGRTDHDFIRQIRGYSVTTAEILYRMPDHPALLQSFLWQDYDEAPRFPRLLDCLEFWSCNLDGSLYKVRVAHTRLVGPKEFRYLDGDLRLA
jgi:uncharacterized protein Usg